MTPISDDDGLNIDIVVGCCRTMDDYSPEYASPSLKSVVRVVPASSVLSRAQSICMCSSRLDYIQ